MRIISRKDSEKIDLATKYNKLYHIINLRNYI